MSKLLRVIRASTAVAVAVFAASSGAWAQAAQEKATYNMAWLPQGSSIGVIVAQERGFFREAGIDLSIVRGYGGNRTANELDQGQFEFGYVDPVSVMLGRSLADQGCAGGLWPARDLVLKTGSGGACTQRADRGVPP